ncbi:MAG: DNA methyltransferase [Bacteroidetes bacterium]|nr:DNA methyltransferase [Bacteroidota bacterium]
MANPPFNVDEVDSDKVKNDPRLPFALPGVNKNGKVSNGNYLWICYFYSYLNEKGRAGFVMSSQASSAGGGEAKVRQKLIETGAVEAMVAIRSNFFYTRTVPCELWFLNRAKSAAGDGGKSEPQKHKDKVLMLDARNVYRKVTRKIYDFSPEQLQNLLSIFWLYRGEEERFLTLVDNYLTRTLTESSACLDEAALPAYVLALNELYKTLQPFLKTIPADNDSVPAVVKEFTETKVTFERDVDSFCVATEKETAHCEKQTSHRADALVKETGRLAPLATTSLDLIKDADLLYKLASRLIDLCESDLNARESDLWQNREITRARKTADETRQAAVEQLKQVRYFHKQALWLTERFPDGTLRDVQGLVKLVDVSEMGDDWSLTPGRYVGAAPEEVDEDFDFEETLRDIHIELGGLNAEAVELATKIAKNFEELGA